MCVCAAGSTRVEQSLEVSIYSLLLRTLCCVGDLQNLVEYHRVNLSMMPPHVAAPVVLVCAEPLAVERGGRMFCVVASLPRRSLVEVLSWAALWRGAQPRAPVRLSHDELLFPRAPLPALLLSCSPF